MLKNKDITKLWNPTTESVQTNEIQNLGIWNKKETYNKNTKKASKIQIVV